MTTTTTKMKRTTLLHFLLLLLAVDARSRKDGRDLIINGDEAQRGRFPYMASLASNGQHRCGGTLVAPDIILTAAHCAGAFEEIQLGRHDLLQDSVFESYVIQDTVIHPRFYVHDYRGVDIDDYDFMLVKMYGASGRIPIKLNREQDLPHDMGEQLLVIGWGTTKESNQNPTDLLRQVTVDYIPNDSCAEIVGKTDTGVSVDLSKRVIDVTLCAADFREGEDTCKGDSGGPIMLQSSNARDDVQVGLTSFGINGCADETFPGFYARISRVQQWIDETVCVLSNNPPADFGCQGPKNLPDFSGKLVQITIEIRLDAIPPQIGWILMSPNENGMNVTYAGRPIFSYQDEPALSVVRETIKIPDDRQYYFVLLDRVGNGLCCSSWIWVYRTDTGEALIPEAAVEGNFNHKVYSFVAGTPPSPAPTITPAPSATYFPSASPTNTRPFITVSIRFDEFASETGWSLEYLPKKGVSQLLAARYPGDYKDVAGGEVRNHVVDLLLPVPNQPKTYRFTMTDNEGDGLCCHHGDGIARVYWETDTQMFNFSEFFLEESQIFTDASVSMSSQLAQSLASSAQWGGAMLCCLLGSVVYNLY